MTDLRKVYDPTTKAYVGLIWSTPHPLSDMRRLYWSESRDAEQQPHASEADAERALLGQDTGHIRLKEAA